MKEEALKLADELQDYLTSVGFHAHQSPKMIRRLVEENDRIIRDLIGASLYEHDYKTLIEKLKPLTKEEVDELVQEHNLLDDYPYDFVKAIEERHGIK